MSDQDFAVGKAAAFLKSLSNPHRLQVLCQLVDGERSVGEMERALGIRQATLSQQLARLREDGLVKTRRAAQTIYYSLAAPEVVCTLALMKELFCPEPTQPRTPSSDGGGTCDGGGPA